MTFRRLTLLTAGAAMAAAPLYAQETPAPTDVAPVEVVGSRAPTSDAPRSATCEYYINQDPALRAWMAIMSDANPSPFGGGDGPSLAVPGPKFYLPTRLPRDPDLKSPPRSAPGSARPDIAARRKVSPDINVYQSGAPATEGDTSTDTDVLGGSVAPADEVAAGIDACRAAFSRDAQQGGNSGAAGAFRAGRATIAANDKTLPMGFALYEDGRFEEALAEFKLAFAKLPYQDGGDEAALMIGKIYLLALGDKNDPAQAVVWLKKTGGSLFDPMTMMPVFDPREPDRNTAIGEAAMLLGRIYLKGAGPVAKDPEEARKWFQRAFNVGHVAAAKLVGDMAYSGAAGPKDLKAAQTWYARGAKFGHAPCQFALARMYETGEAGKKDLALAVAWYNEAAKIEHPASLYALAYAYDTGAGVKADPERAIGLYKTAALKGDHAAQASLAAYFYTGERVEKNLESARLWFEAAAKGGDSEAMVSLAAMMIRGEGGAVDRVKAWSWLHVAQIQKHPDAAKALAALEGRMTADERKAAAQLVGASA